MLTKQIAASHDRPVAWASFGVSMLENAPLPMVLIEEGAHRVRYANPAFRRLVGKPESNLVGESFDEVVAKNDKSLALLDRVLSTGCPASHMEEEHSRTHPFFWSYAMWPVMRENRPVGVMMQVIESAELHEKTLAMNEALIVGSVHQHELAAKADEANTLLQVEIGERKLAQSALHLAQEQLMDRAGQLEGLVIERTAELSATNNQLEAIVYSIAHDLRAPLRAMQAFSTMLLDKSVGLDETGKDYAARIDKSAQFMDAMLIDLLTFSTISRRHVKLTSVSLRTIVDSVLSRLEKDIQNKKASVETYKLFPSVMAHGPTLSEVLFNLIGNALKFVAPGVLPKLRLRTETRSDFIRIWVEDNGLGIACDHQKQIFDLFTRLDGEMYGGTGIGLAIVKKGVERMGGRVGVHSRLGRGSQFWFELPHAP